MNVKKRVSEYFVEKAGLSALDSMIDQNHETGLCSQSFELYSNALFNVLFDPSLSEGHKKAMCVSLLKFETNSTAQANRDKIKQLGELESYLLNAIINNGSAGEVDSLQALNIQGVRNNLIYTTMVLDAYEKDIGPWFQTLGLIAELRDQGGVLDKTEQALVEAQEIKPVMELASDGKGKAYGFNIDFTNIVTKLVNDNLAQAIEIIKFKNSQIEPHLKSLSSTCQACAVLEKALQATIQVNNQSLNRLDATEDGCNSNEVSFKKENDMRDQYLKREIGRHNSSLQNILSYIEPIQAELTQQMQAIDQLAENNRQALAQSNNMRAIALGDMTAKIVPLVSKLKGIIENNGTKGQVGTNFNSFGSAALLKDVFSESVHNILHQDNRTQSVIDEMADLYLDLGCSHEQMRQGLEATLGIINNNCSVFSTLGDLKKSALPKTYLKIHNSNDGGIQRLGGCNESSLMTEGALNI